MDKAKVDAYLDRIGLREAPDVTREGLDQLALAHLCSIPFETTRIHRGGHAPSLDLDDIYRHVVEESNGGYCFELNKLFMDLLLSLGFDARAALCRPVLGREDRMPINHRATIVIIDGKQYLVDVGFGGPSPSLSVLLEDGQREEQLGETYEVRDKGNGWFQIDKVKPDGACINEIEITDIAVEEQDFDALNLACSQPGELFRDQALINMRTQNGHLSYRDGLLKIVENGSRLVIDPNEVGLTEDDILKDYFGISY